MKDHFYCVSDKKTGPYKCCVLLTDKEENPELLKLTCVMRLSALDFQLGYLGICSPDTQKQTQTKCFTCFYSTLRSDCSTCALDESQIFDNGKTHILQIGASCQDKDGAASGISGVNLWSYYMLCFEEGLCI